MRILVDMDGVVADFEKGVLDTYRNRHPDKSFVPLEQRTSFYVKDNYPNELQPLVEEIYLAQGFYLNLPPIDGSLEALSELTSRGDEIYICTSPLLSNPFCVQEKYDWVINHLGKDWTKRMIVSKDKTIVHGDFLIDDKPEVKGVQQPSWEQILYSQPYNSQVNSMKRMTWRNWKSVIDS
ncbi:MAG: 5'-3'-deoxyribonucleotidase [Candidatus Pacearchaeota archaeon]|nr:5'-3'-deoxyribonucleotidase [Candidatus Pacearchaeota archaeon]